MTAMEGRRDEAVTAYIDVAHSWRERELLLDLALTQLEFVTLIGMRDPDARAAADEARAIFEVLGAKPFLARLDGLSAGAS